MAGYFSTRDIFYDRGESRKNFSLKNKVFILFNSLVVNVFVQV